MQNNYLRRAAKIAPATLPYPCTSVTNIREHCDCHNVHVADYASYYKTQVHLRQRFADTLLHPHQVSNYFQYTWGSLVELLPHERTAVRAASNVNEPAYFYFQIIRYLFLTPIYRAKQWRVRRLIRKIGVPKEIIRTFSAISQATDVFNNFLFDIGCKDQVLLNFSPTDLCALYIQLSDEFIDNVRNHIAPDECVTLLRTYWLDVFGEAGTLPFSRGIESLFAGANLDLWKIETKYGISCGILLNIVHSLSNEIDKQVQQLGEEYRLLFIEKFRLSIEQAFSTFLEELYFQRCIERPKHISQAVLEHYGRKTSSVLAAWLELRSINARIPIETMTCAIRTWARLFFDFQIFDDLKDIKQDYDKQLNLLQLVANQYHHEARWLEKNIETLCVDGDLHGTLQINLNMAKSVSHLKLFSSVNANYHLPPFLRATQNFRWKKSWLSSFLSFQKKARAIYIDKASCDIDLTDGVSNALAKSALVCIGAALPLYEETGSIELAGAHCLDILALDDRGYVYRYGSLSRIWHYMVFAPTMSLDKKLALFLDVLRNGKVLNIVKLQLLKHANTNASLACVAEVLR